MSRVYFSEEQKYDSFWIWALIGALDLSVVIFLSYALYQQLYLGESWGENPMPDIGLIFFCLAMFAVIAGVNWLLMSIRLETKLSDMGFMYRFYPFIQKWRTIQPQEIGHYEVRKYSPIKEYGGWGFRVSIRTKGAAYNLKGNMGLQLVLKSGKSVLFGTQRPNDLSHGMKKLMSQGDY